jgi:hypothetical protein
LKPLIYSSVRQKVKAIFGLSSQPSAVADS